MNLPATVQQLVIVLIAVLPGVIYQTVRASLAGPSPHNSDGSARLLRATAASVLFDAVYFMLLGPWLLQTARAATPGHKHWQSHLRELAVMAFVLVVVVPALVATFSVLRPAKKQARRKVVEWLRGARDIDLPKSADEAGRMRRDLADRIENLGYTPTLTWDWAFTDRSDLYVRIFSKSGGWIGGYYGPSSFVASYPESPALFLEEAWRLNEDGQFEEPVVGGLGMYVNCAEVLSLEFLTADESADKLDTDGRSPDTGAEEDHEPRG